MPVRIFDVCLGPKIRRQAVPEFQLIFREDQEAAEMHQELRSFGTSELGKG